MSTARAPVTLPCPTSRKLPSSIALPPATVDRLCGRNGLGKRGLRSQLRCWAARQPGMRSAGLAPGCSLSRPRFQALQELDGAPRDELRRVEPQLKPAGHPRSGQSRRPVLRGLGHRSLGYLPISVAQTYSARRSQRDLSGLPPIRRLLPPDGRVHRLVPGADEAAGQGEAGLCRAVWAEVAGVEVHPVHQHGELVSNLRVPGQPVAEQAQAVA